ncbi:MAG: hypothetical protein LBE25_12395 [Arthrobacter sp.]|jgi:ABC-type branched-subunit amino acid transport system substrate-binding protein|nr:hypothetical protein [Arthrobacter sp.]
MRKSRVIAWAGAGTALVVAAAVTIPLMLRQPHEPTAAPAPVAVTVPVPISAASLPKDLSIGVVLPLGETGEDGTEYVGAAQGAVVAAQRLAQGGHPVTLVSQSDKGTEAGARTAVEQLVRLGASSVVIMNTGASATAAADAAAEAGIPAIAPYAPLAGKPQGVFSLAPTAAQVTQARQEALARAKNVLLVDAGGGIPAGVKAARTLKLEDFDDADALAKEAAIFTGDQLRQPADDAPKDAKASRQENPSDAVVVSAPNPGTAALVVRSLQASGTSTPLILGDNATSPLFATALQERGGSVSSQLVSISGPWSDATALETSDEGRAMSAFLTAVRMVDADPATKNLAGDAPFSDDAWAADARSHDAVVALAQAASAAKSSDAQKIGAALAGLKLGAADGIAGSPLDFSTDTPSTGEVTAVYASNQSLGLRTLGRDDPSLIWIPGPATP